MTDDQINLIQSLIESGRGDSDRLRIMLDTLQKEEPLSDSDQNYLQEITKKIDSDYQVFPNQPSEMSTSNTSPEERIPTIQNPDQSITQDKKEFSANSSRRNKIATITVIIAVVIIAFTVLDAYAVTSLQFRPHHGNQYVMSQTKIFIQSDVCNPSYFPAFFKKYEINAFYKDYSVETAEISGSIISPKTYEILNGVFTLNRDTVTKLQQENFTFDPNLARVTTTVDAPIFGVIPFSVVKNYAGVEFEKVLKNGPPDSFTCG